MAKIFAFVALALLLGACTVTPNTSGGRTTTTDAPSSAASQELKRFGSVQELTEYLRENRGRSYSYGGLVRSDMREITMTTEVNAPTSPGMKVSGASGASEYSKTNVQVQGVDEADFVKNDGKHLYALSGDSLIILDAYPAENARIVSTTRIDGRPRDLFVNGDRLILFVERNDYLYALPVYESMPRPHYTQQLRVIVYDISDRSDPDVVETFTLTGNYLESRMINNYVYFLLQESVQMWEYEPQVPTIRKGDEKEQTITPEIYYFDNPEENHQFVTVASIDLERLDVEATSYLTGYANTVYMSLDALFIAYQKNLPWSAYEEERRDRFWEAVVPALPASVRREVTTAKGATEAEEWSAIKGILERHYASLTEKELRALMEAIDISVQEWEWKRQEERQRTVIHRFSVADGTVSYVAKGEVKGTLLNQFSMDEQKGDLRVATTTDVWGGRGSTSWNNVYVLDTKMRLVGSLERLAEGERIYAARFMGERLYLVTFQRIDPLFVIDLAEPNSPRVLGELKIPGYSDYLHPMGDGYLIGIGKETKENEWGGISTEGVKLALFDVRDVMKPRLVESVEIGAPGSDSEALHEHKAFLFDDEKDLLVLPIREVRESYSYDGSRCNSWDWCWPYRQRVWQGAYVFTVTEQGFEERGKVAHYAGEEEISWYWGSPHAVRRSLFMDDVLYTVSQGLIMMHGLDDVEELNSVKLPYSEPRYDYPRPMPIGRSMEDVAVAERGIIE